MPNWKKVAISGSNISQFNNDGIYAKMKGSTNNGLLTYESAETASVESTITYGSVSQRLCNNGQMNMYSGSYPSSQLPSISTTSALKLTSKLSSACALYTYTGSKNAVLSVVGRHSSFGSGGVCGATLSITSQIGNSSKNASTQLTSIGKTDNCHDTIFTIGVRCDDGSQLGFINEMARFDAKVHQITLTGSLVLDPTHVSASASLGSILVYDNTTGEIKRSTLTPPSSNSVTSVNGQTGVVTLTIPTNNNQLSNGCGYITNASLPTPGGVSGNVQYNDGNDGFDGESSFTYNASTDKLTIKNPGDGTGGLITNNIEGGGNTLVITDGGNDSAIQFCTYGADSLELDDGTANVYGAVHTPDIATTTATDCPSVVISTTGELLAGPVGGAGQTPTLCQVTTAGNTTDQAIVLDNASSNCITVSGTTNFIKVNNANCAAAGRNFIIEGSDNGQNGGCGGHINICAGNATASSGNKGGSLFLNAGTSANSSAGRGCVEVNCAVGLRVCNGSLAIGNILLSSTTGRIDASNDIVAYSTSDCRLKKYVKPIKNALDKIDQIRGVEFDWKVTDEKMEKEVHSFKGHDVGVLAQEIEEVLPEVVTTRDSGYKAVKYEKIVPLLIQGIKELKDEVEILKTKI